MIAKSPVNYYYYYYYLTVYSSTSTHQSAECPLGSRGCWSLSQPSSGEGRAHPGWFAGPSQGGAEKQPH